MKKVSGYKNHKKLEECSFCGSREIGKTGRVKYFCSSCYLEFYVSEKKIIAYSFNESGVSKREKVLIIN